MSVIASCATWESVLEVTLDASGGIAKQGDARASVIGRGVAACRAVMRSPLTPHVRSAPKAVGLKTTASTQQSGESEQGMTSDFCEDLVALLPRLRRFAMTLTGDQDRADDLVQQACEKALLKQEQWQVGTRLDSWVYRIIQNLHIDNLRAQGRRSEHLHDDSVEELVDAGSKDLAERENMLSVVSGLIHELPEEQRVVMLLVAVEEHSYREAAEVLEIPVGTVMSRLARARTKIMAMLESSATVGEGGIKNA